jgi:two-component system cell cycle sensor histidine kinase/response regulator CckA
MQAIDDIQTHGNIHPIIAKDGQKYSIEWYDRTLKGPDGAPAGKAIDLPARCAGRFL